MLFGSYHDQTSVLSDMNQLRASYSGDLYWIDSSWLSAEYFSWPDFQKAQEGWYYDSTAKIVWVKFTISTSTASKVSLH